MKKINKDNFSDEENDLLNYLRKEKILNEKLFEDELLQLHELFFPIRMIFNIVDIFKDEGAFIDIKINSCLDKVLTTDEVLSELYLQVFSSDFSKSKYLILDSGQIVECIFCDTPMNKFLVFNSENSKKQIVFDSLFLSECFDMSSNSYINYLNISSDVLITIITALSEYKNKTFFVVPKFDLSEENYIPDNAFLFYLYDNLIDLNYNANIENVYFSKEKNEFVPFSKDLNIEGTTSEKRVVIYL